MLYRWMRWGLRFQVALDLALLVLFGPVLARGLLLDPVRLIQTSHPFTTWSWDSRTEIQPTQSDLVLSIHPWWEEARREMLRGEFPLIGLHMGAGVPLLANGQTGILAPVLAPVWCLGPERGTTVMAVWKIEAAALGTFLLLALGWRLRPTSAAFGGLLWGLSPFIVAWLLVPLAWSLATMPWIWWSVTASLRKRTNWRGLLLAGSVSGIIMGWGLNPETAAIAVGSALIMGLILHPGRWRRILVIAIIAAVTTLLLAFPTLRLIEESSKVKAYAEVNPNLQAIPISIRLLVLGQTVLPAALGNPGRGNWTGPYPHSAGALGIGGTALVLLLVGGTYGRRRRYIWVLVATLGMAAVLAFRLPPLDWFLVRIPPFDRMTLPRFAMLVPWALTLLAALALDGKPVSRRRQFAGWVLAFLLLCGGVLFVGKGLHGIDAIAVLSTGFAAFLALFLLSWNRRLLPYLAAAELLLLAQGINPVAATVDSVPRPLILERLQVRAGKEPGRVCGLDGALPPNLASRYGLNDLRSFDALRPWPLARLHALLGSEGPALPGPLRVAPPHLLGAWSVRWLVTPENATPAGWKLVDRGDGVRIWSNPAWLPEIRVVGKTIEMEEEAGWHLLAEDPPWLDRVALVPKGQGFASAETISFRVEDRSPARILVKVCCDGPCLLVVARAWVPGWTARVDNQPFPLIRANLAGLGAMAPRGRHKIELRYHAW